MKKDIEFPKSKGVSVALVKDSLAESNDSQWGAYIINFLDTPIEKVFINISAVGIIAGKEKKTSNVRYFIEKLEAGATQFIEPIFTDSLKLTNQYWVSYYVENTLFDRKFIFLPGRTNSKNISIIKPLNKQGVIIK